MHALMERLLEHLCLIKGNFCITMTMQFHCGAVLVASCCACAVVAVSFLA